MATIGDTPLYGGSLEDKTLPPPPPEGNIEVVIRTMESDLALLQKSGGVLSGGQMAVTSVDLSGKPILQKPTLPGEVKDRSPLIIWSVVFVVGAVVLFLTGFYLVPLVINTLTGGSEETTQVPPPTSGGATTTGSQNVVEPISIGHTSYFTNPPNTLDVNLYSRGIPPDRSSFVRDLDAAATAQGDVFFEVIPRSADGRMFSWNMLTGLLGAGDIGGTFIRDHFAPDYTMFMWQSSKGLFPGFIFKLKQGENPILLQKETFVLEEKPASFTKLFLIDPGVPTGAFRDAQVSGQPARMLPFNTGTATSTTQNFFYGWFFQNYLIMSTSDQALRNAIEHL